MAKLPILGYTDTLRLITQLSYLERIRYEEFVSSNWCIVLLEWNPYFSNFQGKSKLVRKIGDWKIRGKITITKVWETTFGSSYREVRKTKGSRHHAWDSPDISNKLILVFNDFLKIKLAKNFKAYMNPDPRRKILPVMSNNKLYLLYLKLRVCLRKFKI